MNVTKEQIKNGLIKYLEDDVVKNINDKPVMMAAAVFTNMIKANEKAMDKLLNNSIVSIMLGENPDGTYNIDSFYNAIIQTMNTYGNFELHIPLVRSPFSFNANDVNNLKAYIEGGVVNA